MDSRKIADLLFPNLKWTTDEIEAKYKPRNLKPDQVVSRYAPSPTGYMHVGNFFQMFISYNLTRITNGKFFLRIEDTDSKREKKDATQVIYEILSRFHIKFDEYQTLDGKDVGDYGPYVQSQRTDIYKAYAKKLVAEGKAFPCFCKKTNGKEDVLKLREERFQVDDEKEYDPCRNLSLAEVKKNLDQGLPFAIRLKTKNDGSQRIKFFDLIKGEIEAKANSKDFILLKADGIPPYAFAHAIDDTLMGTTIVVRGEEYISSTPAHLELFEALGFKPITYCHNPLICKIGDEGNRRKISKRLDPEADMRFYFEKGYPTDSVLEYLLNIINSGFENWRAKNPTLSWQEFKFGVRDITTVAPIFDLVKLDDVSKNVIAMIPAKQLLRNVIAWANEYDKDFARVLTLHQGYAERLLSIDRENAVRPRKDIAHYSEIKTLYGYMFNEYYDPKTSLVFDPKLKKKDILKLLQEYLLYYSSEDNKQEWFERMKVCADYCGFVDMKTYKANPEKYIGNIADASNVIRVALTGRTSTPDLYEIMKLLGTYEIKQRLNFVVDHLLKTSKK